MTATTAQIYAKAGLVFAAQLLAYAFEKNWGLLVAAVGLVAAYHLVLLPDAGTFNALVIGPEGLHATGQRVFGVVSYR